MLISPTGCEAGDTRTARTKAACSQARKARFFHVTELVTLLLEAEEERHFLPLRQQLATPSPDGQRNELRMVLSRFDSPPGSVAGGRTQKTTDQIP